jgi:hypothetical protein
MAIGLLLFRLSSGIPIIEGDAARLQSVSSINPYLGLASGTLPIVSAFIARKGRLVYAAQLVMVILVFGTGSRLLLAAVIVGFVSRSSVFRGGPVALRNRIYVGVIGVIGLFALLRIYALRTEASIVDTFASRAVEIGGFSGFLTQVLGPSLYYSARNGPVMYELLQKYDLNPPGGFIGGGIANAFNFGTDPERWLTNALGLQISNVGAVATPIWSGASADFGWPQSLLVALVLGLALSLWVRRFPGVILWASFGIVLSFYGSYLVSAQFLAVSLSLTVLLGVFGIRAGGDPERPRRKSTAIRR